MKLFITNRSEFEEDFENSKQIHREAYQLLEGALAGGNIPTVLFPEYKRDGNVIFDFVNKNQEVYYYQYSTTIS